MDKVRIAKQLVALAKNLVADDENPYYFVVEAVEKFITEDDYNEGEIGTTYRMSIDSVTEKGAKLKECVEKAFGQFGLDFNVDDLFIEQCYIRTGRMENDNAEEPSKDELELWKQGKQRLWNADYEFKVSMRMDKDCDAAFIESELKKP